MSTSTQLRRPTPKQLNFLKALAARTGQSFIYPTTRGQASREIKRLQTTPASSRRERAIETWILDELQTPKDAARIRDDEITGYGSTATWNRGQAR